MPTCFRLVRSGRSHTTPLPGSLPRRRALWDHSTHYLFTNQFGEMSYGVMRLLLRIVPIPSSRAEEARSQMAGGCDILLFRPGFSQVLPQEELLFHCYPPPPNKSPRRRASHSMFVVSSLLPAPCPVPQYSDSETGAKRIDGNGPEQLKSSCSVLSAAAFVFLKISRPDSGLPVTPPMNGV